MEQASYAHEDVEDRMEPLLVMSDSVKHSADSVGDSSEKKQHRAAEAEGGDGGLDVHKDAPSHAEVADHRKKLILFDVYRIKHYSEYRKSPDDAEYHPSHYGVHAPESNESVGGVCTGNKDKDRAMVDDLKHLFCVKALRKSVIDA